MRNSFCRQEVAYLVFKSFQKWELILQRNIFSQLEQITFCSCSTTSNRKRGKYFSGSYFIWRGMLSLKWLYIKNWNKNLKGWLKNKEHTQKWKLETRFDQISSAGLSANDFRSKQNGLNGLKGIKNIIFTMMRRRFMAAKPYSYNGLVVYLYSGFRSPLSPWRFFFFFFCLYIALLQCFTYDVEYLYVSNLEMH